MPSSSARPESTSSRFKVSVPPYFSFLASSHEAPGCVQQFGQHLPPPVRLLYQRNESAQLEIGDGFIETQALVGIVFGPCLVSGLELADQRVEVIQRAKMPQPEELKMSGKMGHVEQPVILAKLIWWSTATGLPAWISMSFASMTGCSTWPILPLIFSSSG